MELHTLIGEGRAIVTVNYTMEKDSNEAGSYVECEIGAVMFDGVNIFDCLSADQYEELQAECTKAAEEAAHDDAADRGYDAYQSLRDDELMGVAS